MSANTDVGEEGEVSAITHAAAWAVVQVWQRDDEAPVEEAVGALAGGLRDHGAAVTGGAVEEVLGVLGDAPGTDRVR